MKTKKSIIFIASLLLCIMAIICMNTKTVYAETTNSNEIVVIGVGEINYAPDLATISFGIVSSADTVEECQEKNTEKLTSLSQALKEYGIKDENIITKNYSVNQKYDYTNGTLLGYQATYYIDVKTNDLDNLGQLVSRVLDNGANAFYNIEFGINDYNDAYNQALLLALQNAQNKAQVLTGQDNLIIKNIKELEYCYMPQAKLQMSYNGMDMFSGNITISASIQVTFEK